MAGVCHVEEDNSPPLPTSTLFMCKSCGRCSGGRCSGERCSGGRCSGGKCSGGRCRALGYQWGRNCAFLGYHWRRQGINGQYVDGLSLTHGASSSRQHIWTFASGLFTGSHTSSWPRFRCPCDNGNTYRSPPFVGNDYFCESVTQSSYADVFYPNAQLWDGQVCQFNNPPWFTKNLTIPTTDGIELRLCLTESSRYSDVALELLELYVQ